MAIYHCSVKVISRSGGKSAVASAAYRAGEKIENERDGITHDYTKKGGVIEGGIMAPENSPDWVHDRAKLWNSVEQIEKQVNSQLAREFEIAVPKELSRVEQIDFIKEFSQTLVDKGMIVDWNLHDKGDGNPHAHIMTTMRKLDKDGEWMAKSKKEYSLDKNGEKIKCKNSRYFESRKVNTVDWDNKENIDIWRKSVEDITNKHLERAGIEERVDHRSHQDRGLEEIPTIHLGPTAHAMEQKGISTERGNRNREIFERNKHIKELKTQIKDLKDYRLKELSRPKTKVMSQSQIASMATAKHQECKAISEQLQAYLHDVRQDKKRILAPVMMDAAKQHYSQEIKNLEDRTKRQSLEHKQIIQDSTTLGDKPKFFGRDKWEHEDDLLNDRKIKFNTEQDAIKKDQAKLQDKLLTASEYKSTDITTTNKISKIAEEIIAKQDPKMAETLKGVNNKISELARAERSIHSEGNRFSKLANTLKPSNLRSERRFNVPLSYAPQKATLPVLDALAKLSNTTGVSLQMPPVRDSEEIAWHMLTPEQVESEIAKIKDKEQDRRMGR